MSNETFKNHTRENLGLLARAEKRSLVWMAQRMPSWVNSDHLTALGFGGMLLCGAGLALARWFPPALLLSLVFLGVNWFGDSLDGTLARVRNKLRPRYGFYVDHILDAFGAVALFTGLSLSGIMSPSVAVVFTAVYLLLNAEIFLATYTLGTFRMSYWRLGPTELRILFAVGILKAFHSPEVTLLGGEFLLFDVGGVIGAIVLALTVMVSAVRNTRRLFEAEPIT